eukprot:6990966-Pyramimonas_sp.AAC.1
MFLPLGVGLRGSAPWLLLLPGVKLMHLNAAAGNAWATSATSVPRGRDEITLTTVLLTRKRTWEVSGSRQNRPRFRADGCVKKHRTGCTRPEELKHRKRRSFRARINQGRDRTTATPPLSAHVLTQRQPGTFPACAVAEVIYAIARGHAICCASR